MFRPGLQDPNLSPGSQLVDLPSDEIPGDMSQNVTDADHDTYPNVATNFDESGESQKAAEGDQEEAHWHNTSEDIRIAVPRPTTSQKRSTYVTPPPTQPGSKRSRNKHVRQRDSDITNDFASGFRMLAESLTASGGGPSSPERRTAAIKALQDDTRDEMSEDEQVKAVRIFQHNTAVADSYLALEKKSMRLRLIRAELDDLY